MSFVARLVALSCLAATSAHAAAWKAATETDAEGRPVYLSTAAQDGYTVRISCAFVDELDRPGINVSFDVPLDRVASLNGKPAVSIFAAPDYTILPDNYTPLQMIDTVIDWTTDVTEKSGARYVTLGSENVRSDLFDDPPDGPNLADTEVQSRLIAEFAAAAKKRLSVAFREAGAKGTPYVAGVEFPVVGAAKALKKVLTACPRPY
jgi:hypothetical protein